MDVKFRTLRADEIECRVGNVSKAGNGLSLLLYKDARCDMNILDETVGPMNWMRAHSRENANCTVSIWDEDKKQWISKEDTGTESRTESEKGLASDSFKRACVNWGIGRELYTAPFIWISSGSYEEKSGKITDNFTVSEIDYDDKRNISRLVIKNKRGVVVFPSRREPATTSSPKKNAEAKLSAAIVGKRAMVEKLCAEKRLNLEAWCMSESTTWDAVNDERRLDNMIAALKQKGESA